MQFDGNLQLSQFQSVGSENLKLKILANGETSMGIHPWNEELRRPTQLRVDGDFLKRDGQENCLPWTRVMTSNLC